MSVLDVPHTDRRLNRDEYSDLLQRLSEASTERYFLPFRDIPWDDPAFALNPTDDRWILSTVDPIGRSAWYQSLDVQQQRDVGRFRNGYICNTGRQFEQLLVAGIMYRHLWTDPTNPEFRYATHEATEETHHMQMFGEAMRRMCPEASGLPTWIRAIGPLISAFGAWAPTMFFIWVLAGEEPIDHLQKSVLRSPTPGHPLVERVMQIHIAEEARHIGFAHQYIQQRAPKVGPIQRAVLAVAMPVAMRVACDFIMKPTRDGRRKMGMSRKVARQIWWNSPDSKRDLADMFGDVRMLADSTGLRPRWAIPIWRALGIEGRPSRYRSEPARG